MMDAETIRLAKEELNELRKKAYRGPHPQKHLFLYFDWMEKKIAESDMVNLAREIYRMPSTSILVSHRDCLEDLVARVTALEAAISKKETA